MKWIKTDDMKPPIGMTIFWVDRKGNLFLDSYDKEKDFYGGVDFWAPISFFDSHLPQTNNNDQLKTKQNWYLKNICHENIDKMKQIIKELSEKTEEELYEMIRNDHCSTAYYYLKNEEIKKLFEQIDFPDRESEEIGEGLLRNLKKLLL